MRSRRETSHSRYTPQHVATFSCSAAIFSEFTTLLMLMLNILTEKKGGDRRKRDVYVCVGGLRVVPLLLRYFTLAVHCNVLQHTAALCNTLQHSATLCTALHRAAVHCNTLQHVQHTGAHVKQQRLFLAISHLECVVERKNFFFFQFKSVY